MKTILVIEDDPNTLAGMTELLKEEGYSVKGTTSGQIAMGIAINQSIDVVLCDYKLPDLDGLVVCRKIKQIRPDTLIFMFTAYYKKQMKDVMSFCGITRIFIKPIDIDDLLKTIEKSLKKNNLVDDNIGAVQFG